MIPLYVMLAGILAARAVGGLGWVPPLDDWQAATRFGLAWMFLFTASAHFSRERADLITMVPPRLPNPALLVTVTGVVELAGAIGLLVPTAARFAASGLIVLLVLVFPANVYAARIGHTIGGRPHTRLLWRAPMQALWIGLLWWAAVWPWIPR